MGVVTKAQAKQDQKAYIEVPDQILSENKQSFQDTQMSDPKLENIRHKAGSGVVTEGHCLNRGETKIIKRRGTCYTDNSLREIKCNYNLLSQVVLETRC